jgi:hypothetical protein
MRHPASDCATRWQPSCGKLPNLTSRVPVRGCTANGRGCGPTRWSCPTSTPPPPGRSMLMKRNRLVSKLSFPFYLCYFSHRAHRTCSLIWPASHFSLILNPLAKYRASSALVDFNLGRCSLILLSPGCRLIPDRSSFIGFLLNLRFAISLRINFLL